MLIGMKHLYQKKDRHCLIYPKWIKKNIPSFSVSIRSTPYCKSQNNVVPLHGGIIFLILRQEYAI